MKNLLLKSTLLMILICSIFIILKSAYKSNTLTHKDKQTYKIDIDTLSKEKYHEAKSTILKIGYHEFIIIGGKELSPILTHRGSCNYCNDKNR